MASNCSSSVYQTSDLIHDFACSPCKDNGLNNEAHFFCVACKKFYCNNCEQLHNKLFRTHTVLGRQNVSKWAGYAGLSPIEICDKHGDKKLELLCEDHDELCCPVCVYLTHRKCQSIKHIPELVDGLKKQTDFIEMPADVQKIIYSLQENTKKKTDSQKSLKDSGNKFRAEIKSLRNKVNAKFDELEKKTNDIFQEQIHKADDFLQDDIDKCTNLTSKLKSFLEVIQSQQYDNNSFIAYRKCMDKMREAENLLKHLSVKPDKSLAFHGDPMIEQFLSGLNTLETLGEIFDENYVYK
ncbi:TRI33-like protein, partial [Mya arenaria]